MMSRLTSPEARALLSLEEDDRIRFIRAARGGYIDGSDEDWEDGHYLWGPVDFIGDPFPLFRLIARSGRLWIDKAEESAELVPWETPKDGLFMAFNIGYIEKIGTIETENASILYISLLSGRPLVFAAKGEAIAVTKFDPKTQPDDLEACALQAAA